MGKFSRTLEEIQLELKVKPRKRVKSRTVTPQEFLTIVTRNLTRAAAYRAVAFDFESYGESKEHTLDPRTATPDLISFATRDAWEYPVGKGAPIVSLVMFWDDDAKNFLLKLSTLNIWLIAHNMYYDIPLAVFNKALPKMLSLSNAIYLDTMVNVWLLQEEYPLGLKEQSFMRLGITMVTYEEVTKGATKELNSLIKQLRTGIAKEFSQYERKETIKINKFIKDKVNETYTALTLVNGKKGISKKGITDTLEEERLRLINDLRVGCADRKLQSEALASARIKQIKAHTLKDYLQYSEYDSVMTLALFDKTLAEIKELNLFPWYRVECINRVASTQMMLDGVCIDMEKLNRLKETAEAAQVISMKRCFEIANKEFLLTSASQLQQVLWSDLKARIPSGAKISKNGLPGVDKDNLERCLHPMAQAILDFRATEVLITNFFKHLPLSVGYDPYKAGRNHVKMNSIGTETGRWSSQGLALTPGQLQNIPSRDKGKTYAPEVQKLGPKIRQCFIPADFNIGVKMKMIVVDFSQIELRLAAHFSCDANLIKVYTEHFLIEDIITYIGDVHATTAKLGNVPRISAKNMNFGLIYGMTPPTYVKYARLILSNKEDIAPYNKLVVDFISKTLGISHKMAQLVGEEGSFDKRYRSLYYRNPDRLTQAKAILAAPGSNSFDFFTAEKHCKTFKKLYPNIFLYHDKIKDEWSRGCRKWKTISGRHRHFENVDRVSPGTIFNSIVQGSAADWAKLFNAVVYKYMLPKMAPTRILLQVHDEFVFETVAVRESDAEEAATIIKACADYPYFKIRTPMIGAAILGDTWADKDNKDCPPIGKFYARVDGVDRLFDKNNWKEYRDYEKADKEEKDESKHHISVKAAAAVLPTSVQRKYNKMLDKLVPTLLTKTNANKQSIEEWRKQNDSIKSESN